METKETRTETSGDGDGDEGRRRWRRERRQEGRIGDKLDVNHQTRQKVSCRWGAWTVMPTIRDTEKIRSWMKKKTKAERRAGVRMIDKRSNAVANENYKRSRTKTENGYRNKLPER